MEIRIEGWALVKHPNEQKRDSRLNSGFLTDQNRTQKDRGLRISPIPNPQSLRLNLIQILKNGLSLTGVTGDATIVVIGSVLIIAILINNFIQGRANRS